jgi:ABC-type multidrug transport system fused ATPase/permease subunit
MNLENNFTTAEQTYAPYDNIQEYLNDISVIYHEQLNKKSYKTPKNFSQPSVFINGFSELKYIDSSPVEVATKKTSNVFKYFRIRAILSSIVGMIVSAAGIIFLIILPNIIGVDDSEFFSILAQRQEFIIGVVFLGLMFCFSTAFLIYVIVARNKKKKQRMDTESKTIHNLVEKINFSEENKERLEELTKSKPEL